MRTKLILFLPLLWILIGCSDSDSATLNISNSTFNDISASGETLKIEITCDASWTPQAINSGVSLIIPKEKAMEN